MTAGPFPVPKRLVHPPLPIGASGDTAWEDDAGYTEHAVRESAVHLC
jgi:hypothetical protein